MALIRRRTLGVGRRALPLLLLADLLRESHAHWQEQLDPADRARLTALLRLSRGRPANLTARQRAEVVELTRRLDLPGLARRGAWTAAGARLGAGRRR
ncbi:MAG: hypothetical protein M0P31_12910 [Solirubrobacteraceae bacterium]|nr:hypothetical protein [Solirubrobacteraceae bacterium]